MGLKDHLSASSSHDSRCLLGNVLRPMEITSVAYTVFSMKYEYEHCDQVFFVTFHTEG